MNDKKEAGVKAQFKGLIDSLRSKDGKTLVSNFSYLFLLQIASYIFPLITLPYLARVTGAYGMGKVAFATAIMSWILTICDWGFSFTATRDVAKNRDNKEIVSGILSDVTWARFFLSFLSFLVLIVLIFIIPKFHEDMWVILFAFLTIPGHILYPNWFFQAIERMQFITILNLLVKTASLIGIFVFVKAPDDYVLQPLFTSAGYLISGAISIYFIIHKWGYRITKPNFHYIFQALNRSKDVFINNLMPNLYNSFSTMLLGFCGGDAATGKLSASSTFPGAGQQFMQVIFQTFFPFLSRRSDQHKRFARLSLLIAGFITIVLIIIAPFIMKFFFTDEFSDCAGIMRIMAVSVFFLSLNFIYGTNYLIINHHERVLRNITTISSLIGFGISYPLINNYGAIGAALTICISRGLIGTLAMYKAKRL